MRATLFRRRRGVPRRGGISMLVLIISMIVSVLGLSAMLLGRVGRRAAAFAGDAATVRTLARSAVEHGLDVIDRNPLWRSNVLSLMPQDVPLGAGTISVELDFVDDEKDGIALNDDVIITGIGEKGTSRARLSVYCESDGAGVTIVQGSWRRVVD